MQCRLLIWIAPFVLASCLFTSSTPSDKNAQNADPELCGNGEIDPGEACDPCEEQECPDGCTVYVQTGSAATCDLQCEAGGQQTTCTDGDGCCPDGCTTDDDDDCSALCGNGIVDVNETCDSDDCPEDCPPSTDCETWIKSGDRSTCNLVCEEGPVQPDCCSPPCGPSEQCLNSSCVPTGCASDAECALTHPALVCDLDLGECVPGEGLCIRDADCPDSPDGTERVCSDENVCVPADGCTTNAQCAPWQICSGNRCEVPQQCDMAFNQPGWCAFMNFEPGALRAQCDPNATGCQDADPVECEEKEGCLPWEDCLGGLCRIAARCGDAKTPGVWCVISEQDIRVRCADSGDECVD